MIYDINRTSQTNLFTSFLANESNINEFFWKIKRFFSYGELQY